MTLTGGLQTDPLSLLKLGRDTSLSLAQEAQAPYLLQKYLPEVEQGDTRILIFDGKVLGAYNRFAQTDFRSNEAVGVSLRPYKLSFEDQQIVSQLIPFLKERHILFAGVDLIGHFLTEINTTSPTALIPLQKLYGAKTPRNYFGLY